MEAQDNGLQAAAYTPLGQVAPAVWEEALHALRSAGVAAYVVGDTDGADWLVLWVDSDAAAQARRALGAHAEADLHPDDGQTPRASRPGGGSDPAQSGSDPGDDALDDPAWAAIVAAYDAPAAGEFPPWPVAEDVDDTGTEDEPEPRERVLPRPTAETAETVEDDDHFVPPTPPPPPRGDAVTRWAWTGLLGGPVFLFVAALVGADLPDWLLLLVVAGFVAGFVTLVARMQDRPPTDSGPDDGAVV